MGRRNKQFNHFAEKKRNKLLNKPDKRSQPYEEIVRENEFFIKYYKAQKICKSDEEFEEFLKAIRNNLPTTFRITGFKDEAKALLEIIKTQLFNEYMEGVSELHSIEEKNVALPICLPWYPEGMAYQLHLTRKDIRRSEPLFRLHNFLIIETNAGSISRQEGVSMIPPLVLDVKPTDKVLDMCAAPGSKTAQLIEALHGDNDAIPSGFVVANDVDNNRCYMLVHQAKRLNSPCFVVTNHDSCYFPNLIKTDEDGTKSILKFDKILCDVPCSGDGTMRKNPDIWNKWNLGQALNLHGVQYRITRRGAEMLEVGGRLVYSTCSLNPIENEAVLQRIILDSDGALEIIDASDLVPGLKTMPGMTNWIVASKDIEIFEKFDQVPDKYHTVIRPNMFPLPPGEIEKIGLEKCMRILPHFQDTGAFFVAVLVKRKKLPFEKNDIKDLLSKSDEKVHTENGVSSEEKSVPWGPQRKRRRLHGYKEDPYVFFNDDDDAVFNQIKEFYELSDTFDKRCLLTRCNAARKKNIYFCSDPIRDLVLLNNDFIKIINTGVKTFVRCENKHTTNEFRLAQEGLQTANAFVGQSRRLTVERDDLILLLNCTDPTKPPSTNELCESTQLQVKDLGVGSCILKYTDERFTLFIVGWRGKSSLRAYVDSNETVHILRLLRADLSKFQINKFKKNEDISTTDTPAEDEMNGEKMEMDIVEDMPVDVKVKSE